jgi:hypothetical protein
MQDRPDLIQSELAGLAFDSLQQVFRKQDILMMFETDPLPLMLGQPIWIVIDPAAGGPQSDYAVVSMCRVKGCVVVRAPPCVLRLCSWARSLRVMRKRTCFFSLGVSLEPPLRSCVETT